MIGRTLAAAALALATTLAAGAERGWPHLDAEVSVDPTARRLVGEGRLALPGSGQTTEVRLAARFRDATAVLAPDGALVRTERTGEVVWQVPPGNRERILRLRWQGDLDPVDATLDHRETLTRGEPVAGPAGTFLPSVSGWHPAVDGQPISYRITMSLPPDQRGLVAGRLESETSGTDAYRATFAFDGPGEGIDLMAGPYRITETTARSIDGRTLRLRTYFTEGLEALAGGYLDTTAETIARYERAIGPYPFDGFSIVSSPTPTGFGMPSLTYLGADVLKLPFVRETSLVHEILHNWWGNGVSPDVRQGNWSEGLTTFMADYDARERQGPEAAQAMRLGWLRDVTALPPGDDRPLASFTSRTHEASHILGYQKTAMVFFMLRDRIGPEAFQAGLRQFWREHRFRRASWDDLRSALEAASSQDLRPFFDRWVRRAGIPALRLATARARAVTDGWTVEATLRTDLPDGVTAVTLAVDTVAGTHRFRVTPDRAERQVAWRVSDQPIRVRLDPELETLRRLAPEEAPPILRDAMVRRDLKLVLLHEAAEYLEGAANLAARFADTPPISQSPDAAPASPLLVIGPPERIARYASRHGLGVRPEALQGQPGAGVWVTATRSGPVVFVEAPDTETLAGWARPLPHYGSQSWLRFDGRRVVDKGVARVTPQSIVLGPSAGTP